MAKINLNKNSRISPIKDFGVSGYQMNFSCKDLNRLTMLGLRADMEIQNHFKDEAAYKQALPSVEILMRFIHSMVENTVGIPYADDTFEVFQESAE